MYTCGKAVVSPCLFIFYIHGFRHYTLHNAIQAFTWQIFLEELSISGAQGAETGNLWVKSGLRLCHGQPTWYLGFWGEALVIRG